VLGKLELTATEGGCSSLVDTGTQEPGSGMPTQCAGSVRAKRMTDQIKSQT